MQEQSNNGSIVLDPLRNIYRVRNSFGVRNSFEVRYNFEVRNGFDVHNQCKKTFP